MSLAAAPLIPNDGSLTFSSSGGGVSWTLQYEDGDFKFGPTAEGQKDVEKFFTRGAFYAARKTMDKVMPFSFTAHAVGFTDATAKTAYNMVRKLGPWAGATSTLPTTAGDVWCLQTVFAGERTNFGASADASVTMKYCHMEIEFSEGTPGKFTISGELYPYSTDYFTEA
jgi:hypothetical protein